MRLVHKLSLLSLLCLGSAPAIAALGDNQYEQQNNTNSQNMVQYLLHLGGFLGYDLTKDPQANNNTISQTLFDAQATQLLQSYLFTTFLGSIPVNTFSQNLSQFLPTNLPDASILNAFANTTFANPPYNSPSTQGGVAVTQLVDQQTFQKDPVSQGILNILATPDSSYCMSYDGSTWTPNCSLLYQSKVMSNVIGTLPSTYAYYTYDYNQKFISQLNSNTLMSPLLYSTQSDAANTTSSGNPNPQNTGLSAQNQAQQAANFIRYVTGTVAPTTLPKLRDYDTVYSQATNTDGSVTQLQKMQAQARLTAYFTSLRIYAAQTSVGLSNLYYILSKRMPQNPSNSGNPTSQAKSEFTMATWRLYNPDLSPNKQWITQINNASPATVQKEIATLLAEINYQMYLSRQQEERLLLTNSLMLIQNTKASQPTADFSSQGSAPVPTP